MERLQGDDSTLKVNKPTTTTSAITAGLSREGSAEVANRVLRGIPSQKGWAWVVVLLICGFWLTPATAQIPGDGVYDDDPDGILESYRPASDADYSNMLRVKAGFYSYFMYCKRDPVFNNPIRDEEGNFVDCEMAEPGMFRLRGMREGAANPRLLRRGYADPFAGGFRVRTRENRQNSGNRMRLVLLIRYGNQQTGIPEKPSRRSRRAVSLRLVSKATKAGPQGVGR